MPLLRNTAVTVLIALCALAGGETVDRLKNESLIDFAKRVLPPGKEFAHAPLEGAFGPSDHNIVLLFRPAAGENRNYTGWVFIKDRNTPGLYAKYVLPPMQEVPGLFDIAVRSVLYARATPGQDSDLIVMFEYHRNGSSSDSGYASNVYHWDGGRFKVLEDVNRKLSGLRTAAQVRQKLKAYRSSARRQHECCR